MSDPRELIASTADADYWQAQDRNDDLTALSLGIHFTVARLGLGEDAATLIKESIVCAYLLGRRDAVSVPSVFTYEAQS